MGIIKQKTLYRGIDSDRRQDLSLRWDANIKYSIDLLDDNRKKLVGTDKAVGFRAIAYFTTCIEPAKQSIRMDYMMKKVGIV